MSCGEKRQKALSSHYVCGGNAINFKAALWLVGMRKALTELDSENNNDIDTKRQLKRWIVIEMITVNLMGFLLMQLLTKSINWINTHSERERKRVHLNAASESL